MDNHTVKQLESKQSKATRVEKLSPDKAAECSIPYTIVSTIVIRKIKNMEALAIWVYLLSLPPDWIVYKSQVKSYFKIGDDKLKTIFSYLRRSGLIKYTQQRLDNGKFGEIEINVLSGSQFNPDESYVSTGGVKTTPVVFTGGVIHRPAVDHTCGSGGLQIKDIYKEKISTKERRDFSGQKSDNRPKPQEWDGPAPSASEPSPLLKEMLSKKIDKNLSTGLSTEIGDNYD